MHHKAVSYTHLLLHGERHGEEQLVILPSVEGCHHGVGVHLLGQLMRLPGDRKPQIKQGVLLATGMLLTYIFASIGYNILKR